MLNKYLLNLLKISIESGMLGIQYLLSIFLTSSFMLLVLLMYMQKLGRLSDLYYLGASLFTCHFFMGMRGRHGTPGSETKCSLLITAIAMVRVWPFLHQLLEPSLLQGKVKRAKNFCTPNGWYYKRMISKQDRALPQQETRCLPRLKANLPFTLKRYTISF